MRRSPRPLAGVLALAFTAALVAGCGSVGPGPSGADLAAGCRSTVMDTIEQVAMRAYDEVAGGRVVTGAQVEVERSRPLIRAVAAGDSLAATQAARALAGATEIAFLRVQRGRRVLVNIGEGPAIARATGVLRLDGATVGRFAVAVQGDAGYAAVVHGLTDAAVLVREGRHQLAGTFTPGPVAIPSGGVVRYGGADYVARTFSEPAYMTGAQRISLLAPPSLFAACGSSPAQTVANILGPVAERIYAHEALSHSALETIAYIARSPAFVAAVAAADPVMTRAAIITFFRSHRHIVRVRALRGGQLVNDVGGPFALAPVSGTLQVNGHPIGQFVTAIQDDAGYVALTRAYTGAQVILRAGSEQIPSSTLSPGPAWIPDHGALLYQGRTYEAYSFTGTAFPTGTLRISLLVPIAG